MSNDVDDIWHQFHQELKTFVTAKVGNPEDADDILQNAFVKIIKHKDRVLNARDLRQYLYAILRNETVDFLRPQKGQKRETCEHFFLS